MANNLTVIIPCKNEEQNIGRCIESVQAVAAEVLVADSGSTDGTMDVARSLGCRIIEREYVHSGDFKNWAIPQATYPWILLLDADERLTPELAAEIEHELSNPQHSGYYIPRLNYFMGHLLKHGVWYPDCPQRLFQRDLGRFVGSNDHAAVEINGGINGNSVGMLQEPFIHYTFWTFAQYLPKIYRYAQVQSQLWHENGRKASPWQILARGPLRFLQSYVWKRGFLDGKAGLLCSIMIGYQSFLKQALLWELQHARRREELEPPRQMEETPIKNTA